MNASSGFTKPCSRVSSPTATQLVTLPLQELVFPKQKQPPVFQVDIPPPDTSPHCFSPFCMHAKLLCMWSHLKSTEHRNNFLEGVTDLLWVTEVLATEKNKNCPWKYCNLVHKNSIESVVLLFRIKEGGAGKGRKAFFFPPPFLTSCLFVTSLNSRSFQWANKQTNKRLLVLTHTTSSTFTGV